MKVKYLSDAYFQILTLIPEAKSVFALGDRLLWLTPSGKALAIDADGTESMSTESIRALFSAR